MQESHPFGQVAHDLDGVLADQRRLEGGSSAAVWRLEIRMANGRMRRVVYRSHRATASKLTGPSIANKEYRLLQVLWDQGMAVAAPLLVLKNDRALVTEWVDGTADVDSGFLQSALQQMAGFLNELHQVELRLLEDVPLRAIEDPAASLPRYLPATATGRQLGEALESGSVAPPTNNSVLIHGDYWPGNMLWHEGHLAAVIDWEDAWLGDALADLACARVELLCQYDGSAMHTFTENYLTVADHLDIAALPLWECYVSATALASMHLWGLDAAEESRRRALTTGFFERAAADVLH